MPTFCPVDPTGQCVTNQFGLLAPPNSTTPRTVVGVRKSALPERICPVGTERCPEVATAATPKTPLTRPSSERVERAAPAPRLDQPVAERSPANAPVANIRRGLLGEALSG
jgi:hypothetical protein